MISNLVIYSFELIDKKVLINDAIADAITDTIDDQHSLPAKIYSDTVLLTVLSIMHSQNTRESMNFTTSCRFPIEGDQKNELNFKQLKEQFDSLNDIQNYNEDLDSKENDDLQSLNHRMDANESKHLSST